MNLDGGVTITVKGGSQLRANHMAIKTSSNGVQELTGDEFRIVKSPSL
jgi:hypothetical protein